MQNPWDLMECIHRYREGAGQCHCKVTVHHLCQVMAIKAGSCWLGKKRQTSHPSTRRRRWIQVTTASQLSPWERYGANPPERHFETHKGQKSDWKQPRVNHPWPTSLLSVIRWLVLCKGLQFRRTSTVQRNGLTGDSWSSTKENAKSCTGRGITPCHFIGWS